MRVVGYLWYDEAKGFSRLDRTNGRYNPFCSAAGGSSPCSQLVRDGKRYIVYPLIKLCCFCCDSAHGCGILKKEWPSVGYTYEGVDELSGQFYDKFRNEQRKSSLWVTRDTRQIQRKFSEDD